MRLENKGFSLVEVLLTIALVGVIMGTGTTLFLSIIRSSTKARVLTEVKQNGNYAMNLMDRQIRNARTVELVGGDELVVRFLGGGQTVFLCDGTDGLIKQDGVSLVAENLTVTDCSSVFAVIGSTPPVVSVVFTLAQNTASARPEDIAQVSFDKSITLRNYD